MKIKITKFWILVLLLAAAGGVYSFWDFKQYRFDEMSRFGQGWKDIDPPAQNLDASFEDKELGIRIKYPSVWKIENRRNSDAGTWSLSGIRIGDYLEVGTINVGDRIEDIVNNRYFGKGAPVWITEKETVKTNDISFTVMTYKQELPGGKANIHQEAWGKKGDKLVVAKVTVPAEEWSRIRNTITEIYRQIAVI